MSRFTSNKLECPNCLYEGLFYLGEEKVIEGVQWWFYVCPNCDFWVASNDQVNLLRLIDLDFVPLGLKRPENK